MFGGELLVAFSQSQRLGRLDESAGAVRVFFEIHVATPSAHYGAGNDGPPKATRRFDMWGEFSTVEGVAVLLANGPAGG